MQIFNRETIQQINVITLKIQALDAGNVKHVNKCLSEVLTGEERTIVDLGALRYFDVNGFAAILKWAAGGPAVRLCSQSGTIQALFELLRGDTVVRLYRSGAEAMESFGTLGFPETKSAELRPSQEAGEVPASI